MIYVYDFEHDNAHPLSQSNSKVVINAPGYSNQEIEVPSDATQNRYWLIGCFKGANGIGGSFELKNQLLQTNPNTQLGLCS